MSRHACIPLIAALLVGCGEGPIGQERATTGAAASMNGLPRTNKSLLLRTDFSDDAAWTALCEAVQEPSPEGFQAHVDCISDPAYDGLTVAKLVALASAVGEHTFAFIADRVTLTDAERPVLVVDLYDEPGRVFRVIPGKMASVENNLSIANMDFFEFADNVDPDGVFRGFPQP